MLVEGGESALSAVCMLECLCRDRWVMCVRMAQVCACGGGAGDSADPLMW